MNNDVLIKVENVSKKFCKDLNLGLLYGLKDLGSSVFGSGKTERNLRKKEFWAVNNINFEVKRGECLGLLGHNGAGKSTLLKVLTGLIAPDRGKITIKGRVNALIELTAGFNPILTGRENIYNNAAVLGLSDQEIKEKFDEIVTFSELEEFIDTPVQYYSSGMKVRLGFSVAAFTEPDVLILDEVLSVGDVGFQIKSYNKMKEIMKTSAVIFVSHSMPQVARTCDQVLFMRNGVEYYLGKEVHKGIDLYFNEFKSNQGKIESTIGGYLSNFQVNNNQILTENLDNSINIEYGNNLILNFKFHLTNKLIKEYYAIIRITDKDMKMVGTVFTNKFHDYFKNEENNEIEIILPKLNLIDGEYTITYIIAENNLTTNTISSFLCIYRDYIKIKMNGLKMVDYAPVFFDSIVKYNGKEI